MSITVKLLAARGQMLVSESWSHDNLLPANLFAQNHCLCLSGKLKAGCYLQLVVIQTTPAKEAFGLYHCLAVHVNSFTALCLLLNSGSKVKSYPAALWHETVEPAADPECFQLDCLEATRGHITYNEARLLAGDDSRTHRGHLGNIHVQYFIQDTNICSR